MTAPPDRLEQLTGLRFIAAFAVMASHLTFLAHAANPLVARSYDLLLAQGYCGVSFFFLLSGFVLAHCYAGRLRGGEIGVSRYLFRRAVRILPLHWLVTLGFAAWLALEKGAPPATGTLVLNLALLHGWVADPLVHYSLNGPSWSLSAELFFYALFPMLILIPARWLAGAMTLGLLGVAAAAARVGTAPYSAALEWLFYVHPLVRLIEFTGGCLIHAAWQHGRLNAPKGTVAEIACIAIVVLAMVGYARLAVPMPFRAQLAYLPPMALALIVFASGRGAVSRWLASPPLRLLGAASFALYLVHRPVMTFAAARWGQDGGVALAAALMTLCPLLAIAIHIAFEQPLAAALRRLEKEWFAGSPRIAPALDAR